MLDILKQFTWVQDDLEMDGSFNVECYLSHTGHFGTGRSFGWWTAELSFHHTHDCHWGLALLEDQHLSDREGWKLPDNQIPWLKFEASGASLRPQAPPSFEHNWASSYKWRGLPAESPACLLLHWPLTVYRLLFILGLVATEIPKERRHLLVHLVGIEMEVDFLPM
ncbi:hypothetical protein BDZ97DRAFT_1904771 [Flammula alnicola]|nr:hypothetical protein BDZ97DRAFT_1904771 [Flammula alnicola]